MYFTIKYLSLFSIGANKYEWKYNIQLRFRTTYIFGRLCHNCQNTRFSTMHEQNVCFFFIETFQNTAMTRSTQNENCNGQNTPRGTQCENKLTINCDNVLDCHTSPQSYIVVSNMSIPLDLEVG